jgi:hypothetical protein
MGICEQDGVVSSVGGGGLQRATLFYYGNKLNRIIWQKSMAYAWVCTMGNNCLSLKII